jgi:hypothetical protein
MDGWRVRKSGDLFWASVIVNEVHDDKAALLADRTETSLPRSRLSILPQITDQLFPSV